MIPKTMERSKVELRDKPGSMPALAATFNLVRVVCVDETDPEWIGEDEIHLKLLPVDDKGNLLTYYNQMKLGDFDEGQSIEYGSLQVVQLVFSQPVDKDWPRTFSVNMVLIEADQGGEGLPKFFEMVKDGVNSELASLKNSGVKKWEWLAKIGEYVFDKAYSALEDAWNDDVFPNPQTATLTIPTQTSKWVGTDHEWRGPVERVDFYGHDGHYRLYYKWGLIACPF